MSDNRDNDPIADFAAIMTEGIARANEIEETPGFP